MRLHLRFRNFKQETLDAAQALFDAKPWRLEDDLDKAVHAVSFLKQISRTYGVSTPQFFINPNLEALADYQPARFGENLLSDDEGTVLLEPAVIGLKKWSITTLFHFARLHLLTERAADPVSRYDPYAWSCSLFYAVKPVMFRARARERRIVGVEPIDTYSTPTVERMRALGIINADDEVLITRFDPRDLPRIEAGEITVAELVSQQPVNGVNVQQEVESGLSEAEQFLAQFNEEQIAQSGDSENDGLDGLGITELRRLSRGVFSGGYSLRRPELIAKLREHGVRA